MSEKDYIAIHTHDRITFKRCRLKWYFSSEIHRHLVSVQESRGNLWFGTGIHFALEDFHGHQRFSTPRHAFQAYYNIFKKHYPEQLPIDHEDLLVLGHGMLEYYPIWLAQRNEYETLWINGEPQVEVDFSIELPELSKIAGKPVYYQGTFDRVVVDPFGRLWIEDYKTAKQFDTLKLELDPQVSAYCWAGDIHYSRLLGKEVQIEGMIYLQMKKQYPKYPRVTRQGLSVDKKQYTTYNLFKKALAEYGCDLRTQKYVDYLSYLAEQETLEGDRFIRWDRIRRNECSKDYEYQNILMEGSEMINPDLPIYPNPTRDCSWDCDFRSVHMAMMDGSDWEWLLQEDFKEKEDDKHVWRSKIVWEDPQLPELDPLRSSDLQLSL